MHFSPNKGKAKTNANLMLILREDRRLEHTSPPTRFTYEVIQPSVLVIAPFSGVLSARGLNRVSGAVGGPQALSYGRKGMNVGPLVAHR